MPGRPPGSEVAQPLSADFTTKSSANFGQIRAQWMVVPANAGIHCYGVHGCGGCLLRFLIERTRCMGGPAFAGTTRWGCGLRPPSAFQIGGADLRALQ